jgi:uncharacterized membrane protein YedE/YeeE
MVSTLAFAVTGLLVGAAFGFVLQRGRFCVNSAFREVLFQDYTMFRAYLLAVVVTMIGANFLEDMHWLGHFEQGAFMTGHLYRQAFVPWANIIGGYIFGMGIVLAGGCGSGILYRVGEGNLAYVFAVFGFFFGIAMTKFGFLKPIYDWMIAPERIVWKGDDYTIPTLYNITGINKWIIIAVVSAVLLVFIFRGKPFVKAKKGYSWSMAGFLAGLVAVAAWWASEYYGGKARGLSFTGPLREFFLSVFFGNYQNNPAAVNPLQSRSIFGMIFSWSSLYVLAVPLGAFISGKLLKEVKLKVPPADELLKVGLGGFIMGVGAQMGGGCNIGHSLTGVSTLAVSSWVANIFIILGNWTMVYFLLIRPMRDLDV